jgi:hypothetical protein
MFVLFKVDILRFLGTESLPESYQTLIFLLIIWHVHHVQRTGNLLHHYHCANIVGMLFRQEGLQMDLPEYETHIFAPSETVSQGSSRRCHKCVDLACTLQCSIIGFQKAVVKIFSSHVTTRNLSSALCFLMFDSVICKVKNRNCSIMKVHIHVEDLSKNNVNMSGAAIHQISEICRTSLKNVPVREIIKHLLCWNDVATAFASLAHHKEQTLMEDETSHIDQQANDSMFDKAEKDAFNEFDPIHEEMEDTRLDKVAESLLNKSNNTLKKKLKVRQGLAIISRIIHIRVWPDKILSRLVQ